MPLSHYVESLTKYHVFIFNSKKQEAIGNVITAIHLGMKVFMNEKGLVYKFCKENDLLVFSVQKELTSTSVNTRLTAQEIENNRSALERIWGEDIVKERAKNGIRKLINE